VAQMVTTQSDIRPSLIKLLGQILKIEYSFIISYPRLSSMITDSNTKAFVLSLGKASIKYASVVAAISYRLGGHPASYFKNVSYGANLIEILTEQLAQENQALRMYEDCADLIKESAFRFEFAAIANERRSQIKVVEQIIDNLKLGADKLELNAF
jgi:bacterioferritin (cytochrome b1)